MAKSKKSKKKTAKKAATKAPARKKTAAKPRLSVAERQAALKPGDDLNELLEEIATAWRSVARKVRVDGLSVAKLASLAKKADAAAKKEADLAAKQQAKLAPLTDARILARDAAYRAGLKVKRIADALATDDTEVADAFAVVTERFRRGSTPSPSDPVEA
jgi:hypothetical protein